jgi:hypothetical protein
MRETELIPLVYTAWPDPIDPSYNNTLDITSWPMTLQNTIQEEWTASSTSANRTVVDDLFGFNQSVPGGYLQYAPVFPLFPIDYNIVISYWQNYSQQSVYLLAKPPIDLDADEYVMCGIRGMMYNNCTTQYHVE